MERLDKLKVLLDPPPTDDVLTTYLSLADDLILNRMYPYGVPVGVDSIPTKYYPISVQIACEMFLKKGAEGELTHTEAGITRQYANGTFSSELLKSVTPYCGVIK